MGQKVQEISEGKKQGAAGVETLEARGRALQALLWRRQCRIYGVVDVVLGSLLPLVLATDVKWKVKTFDLETTPRGWTASMR